MLVFASASSVSLAPSVSSWKGVAQLHQKWITIFVLLTDTFGLVERTKCLSFWPDLG